MNKAALFSPLKAIAENSDRLNLTHREVRILAFGLSSVLPDIAFNSSSTYEQIELFLAMISKFGLSHQSRSYFAQHCIHLLEIDALTKCSDNF